MDPIRTEFEWKVAPAGYARVKVPPPGGADHKPGDYLVPIVPSSGSPEERVYRPLDEAALFRIFADTPTTIKGIVEFAREFGLLGCPRSISPPPGMNPSKYVWVRAESIEFWRSEIDQMKNAVYLYDSCRTSNKAALASVIFWDAHFVSYKVRRGRIGKRLRNFTIASDIGWGYPLADYNRGDLVSPAWSALLTIVNASLADYPATPRLFKDPRAGLFAKPRLVPSTLLSAMWTQMYQAITGNKEYGKCDQCGRWFEIAAEKRKDAKFCSNACRFKAYRERQKRAKQLHLEGVPLTEVAAKLGSDVETVKGWVNQ